MTREEGYEEVKAKDGYQQEPGVMRRLFLALACLPLAVQAAAEPPPRTGLDTHASGVFLNPAGDVLTAHHAVGSCSTIYVVKDGRVVEAKLGLAGPELDLAVLHTTLKPYLSATLAQTEARSGSSIGVFSEAYSVLQRLPGRATLVSNAITVPGEDGMQLLSGVKPGASGSAVIGGAGLVLGVVVARMASVSSSHGAVSSTMLSRAAAAGVPTGASVVRAVGVTQVKQFLRDGGIPFTESDAAQLGATQSPAARAATLSVGIICG